MDLSCFDGSHIAVSKTVCIKPLANNYSVCYVEFAFGWSTVNYWAFFQPWVGRKVCHTLTFASIWTAAFLQNIKNFLDWFVYEEKAV